MISGNGLSWVKTAEDFYEESDAPLAIAAALISIAYSLAEAGR